MLAIERIGVGSKPGVREMKLRNYLAQEPLCMTGHDLCMSRWAHIRIRFSRSCPCQNLNPKIVPDVLPDAPFWGQ